MHILRTVKDLWNDETFIEKRVIEQVYEMQRLKAEGKEDTDHYAAALSQYKYFSDRLAELDKGI